MKAKIQTLWILAALGAALFLVACEDTDLTAPPDGSMVVTANPATVVIDPNQGQSTGQSTIIATLFDSGGQALQNVSVIFSTTGGTLSPSSAKTDEKGVASVTLTLDPNDPTDSVITAQSSSISQFVAVTLTVIGANQPPGAAIVPVPLDRQIVNLPVVFDGTVSNDPDGDLIVCYQWVIDSSINTSDEAFQGPGTSGFSRTYADPQILNVTLRVSDDPTLQCGAADPLLSQNV